MTTALEQSFAAICAQHGLTAITLGMNLKQREESRFTVTVHWDGFTSTGHRCTNAHGATLQAALDACLDRARDERRAPLERPVLPDEALLRYKGTWT